MIRITARFILAIFRFILMIFRLTFSCIRKAFSQSNDNLNTSEWPEGFDSPSACKTITFSLTEAQLLLDTCPIMKFLQKNSGKFQHVEFQCTFSRQDQLNEIWCSQFIAFLQILSTNSQLISVTFWHLASCFRRIETRTYIDLCKSINHFLESQHRLKEVGFHSCYFRFNEGVEILRKLKENNRQTLSDLMLVDFLRYEPVDNVSLSPHDSLIISPSTAAQNIHLLDDFPKLTSLRIDYPLILKSMVARQSTSIQTGKYRQMPNLSKIFLHYDSRKISVDAFGGTTSTDWQLIKSLCPDLQVEWIIRTNSASLRELEFLIVPNMPITRLTYICENFNIEMEIGVLFDHLLACKINNHLDTLDLTWRTPIPNIADIFSQFLQACRKLIVLELCLTHPAIGLDNLMQSWLKNRPESLGLAAITIMGVEEEEEYANLKSTASELKLKGLDVDVYL